MRATLLTASLLLSLGCHRSEAPRATAGSIESSNGASREGPPRPATPAQFAADGTLSGPGAPDRATCAQDSDCVVTDLPSNRAPAPPPHLAGCCPASGFNPVSRAFYEWVTRFQAQHCPQDRAECPGLPAPAMPAPCVHQAVCRAGRCANACGS
jgi:hypothetical protein